MSPDCTCAHVNGYVHGVHMLVNTYEIVAKLGLQVEVLQLIFPCWVSLWRFHNTHFRVQGEQCVLAAF